MIAKLRRNHRIAAVLLALLAPLIFVTGIKARRAMPVTSNFPPLLFVDNMRVYPDRLERDDLFGDLAVITRVFGTRKHIVLELEPVHDLNKPDLLVYWFAQEDQGQRDQYYLLGSLAGKQSRRYILPPLAYEEDGFLALYSLGHDETIAEVLLPASEALQTRKEEIE